MNTLTFDSNELDAKALRYVKEMCHLDSAGIDQALAVRNKLGDALSLKAVYKNTDPNTIMYIITAGEYTLAANNQKAPPDPPTPETPKAPADPPTPETSQAPADSLMNELLADSWGTAYIAAGLDVLSADLQEKTGGKGVLNLWPGCNDISVSEIDNIFGTLNAALIGVSRSSSGMMNPIKSCAGYFKSVDYAPDENLDCQNCLADKTHCDFCYARIRRGNK